MPAEAASAPAAATPAASPPEFDFDVFISYSHQDEFFVKQQLLPKLVTEQLKVCLDSEAFAGGAPSIKNMERAVERSRHTIAVLSPEWVESEWCEYEALLVSKHDPVGRRRRLVPLLLRPCKPSDTIGILTYRDFSENARWETEWPLLFRDLRFAADQAVSAEQKAAAGSVVRGIEVLIAAMQQQSGVRAEVKQFQGDFEEVEVQLRKLNFYKQLHDSLHEVEMNCFRMLGKCVNDFPDGNSHCDCGEYESELAHLISDLEQTVAGRPAGVAEPTWIPRLVTARSEIRTALDTLSRETLASGIEKLGRILAKQPSMIDTTLSALAENLRLKSLSLAMMQIHNRLASLQIAADQLQDFRHGAENLFNLNQRLEHLVQRHHGWQGVDDELRQIHDLLVRDAPDLHELIEGWDQLRSLLDPLVGDPSNVLLADVRVDTEKLTKAIADQENPKMTFHFSRVRSGSSNHFYRVDKALKDFCEKIAAVGAPISLVLKTLSS